MPPKVDRLRSTWDSKGAMDRRRGHDIKANCKAQRPTKFCGAIQNMSPRAKCEAGNPPFKCSIFIANQFLRCCFDVRVQIKERWLNNFDPATSFSHFTMDEDQTILAMRGRGCGWANIAKTLGCRTQNQVRMDLKRSHCARPIVDKLVEPDVLHVGPQ